MKKFHVLIFLLFPAFLFAQQTEYHGRVVDSATGAPLASASIVLLSNTNSRGTTTDTAGYFTIMANPGQRISVSSVGYDYKTVTLSDNSNLVIALHNYAGSLNDVVVIGYGTQKKRDLTGSITVVKGDVIANMPATNPVSSLQGKVAGLTVINSGQAGKAPTVRIRGVNSTNNSDPLYVVDGILQTNIDYINQADIETVEVLKDPSSTAIYGLQGGNGVIIITTKRAAKGQTRVNFTTNEGIQKVIRKLPVTNASQFKELYNQQLNNLGAAPFDYTNYTANTDWQDQIFRSALLTNNTLSISNSTDKSTTYLSLGYSNQQGVERDDNYKKYIARLNEEIRITNNIRVGAEVSGYYWTQNPPAGGIINGATWAAPIVPIQAGPGLYYAMPSFQRAQVGNPVAAMDNARGNTLNSGYRVTGDVFAEIKFLKHLTWKSSLYTDLSFNNSRSYTPLPFHFIELGESSNNTATDTSYAINPHTAVAQSQATYKTYQQDHTLTYDNDFGEHHITALFGFTTLYHYNETVYGKRTDTTLYIPDNPMFWYLSVVPVSNPTDLNNDASISYQGEDASISYMARVNYSYKNKYLVNATFRRDGTSKFSPNRHWGNFASVGLGWVMTDESFMKDVKWINFLKLKASWGTVGNGLSIGNYLSYPALINSGVGIFGDRIFPSITAQYVPDPNLHWEKVEGKDAGFEANILNNKLNLDVDFYDRKTHDILTKVTVPNSTLPYFTNLGDIDNKGIEATAGWSDKIGKDFHYSIGGNFSLNSNKVISIGNTTNFDIDNGINFTRTGSSIGAFYGYKQIGIFQTTAQLEKTPHLTSALPGDIEYADINNDGKIDANDRTYLGSPFPKYNFGGNISLSYKGVDLGIDLQGVAGNKIYVARRTATFAILNYETNRLKAWNGAGTSNVEPILDYTRTNNYLFSNYWLEPGSYLRIRTIQLGYTFNPASFKKVGINMLRIYISGQNIATFTKATGYTPEAPLDSPTTAGADNGLYPVPAIWSVGLNMTL